MKRTLASLNVWALLLGAPLASTQLGCRGQVSSKPPVHIVPDMDWQPKYRPEAASTFFNDGRSMRPLVDGTVARGQLREDDALYRGKVPGTETFVPRSPIPVTHATLDRGQERFNIYCTPCHDRTGSGHGLVVQRGFFPPVDFHSDRVRNMPDGEIFNVMSHGVRNMPSYAYQVPVEDRWAIVGWIRVLERSQHASLDDVPQEMRDRIEPEGGSK